MGIIPETIIKEKIVSQKSQTNTQKKPKLNNYDDY